MLGGGKVKRILELYRDGMSIHDIVRTIGISRNTVRYYVRNPGVRVRRRHVKRLSKLESFEKYLSERMAEGVFNCTVLFRELRERGYVGGYTILKDYVKPFRQMRPPKAVVRFETEPGQQAQVDWGQVSYQTVDGHRKSLWVFVMVLGWSRAIYVEFVERADVSTFLRCHAHAFQYYGIPHHCLYDNAKVVVTGRDENGEPVWNRRFLDFSLRLGFDAKLCRPYRAQTKGKTESGVKYVKRNFWPGVRRFEDLADLNRLARVWMETVANPRTHGTTHERPVDRLPVEREHLRSCPSAERLAPFLHEVRKVGRDGFIKFNGSYYGVPWRFAGLDVHVSANSETIEILSDDHRVALHPRAQAPGRRLTVPGQWEGLPLGSGRPSPEVLVMQTGQAEVEKRPLAIYQALAEVSGQ